MINFKKTTAVVMVILCLFTINACNTQTSNQSSEQYLENGRYLIPVFEKVDIESNISYSEAKNSKGEMESLTLDIYKPSGDVKTDRPAVMLIHGGSFIGGDKESPPCNELAYELAKRGYVTVSINYRLRPEPSLDWGGTFADTNEDALAALNWIRKNSEKYGIDKNHIAVCGESAGGVIAINLAYCGDTSGEGVGKEGIFAVVDLYGPYMWAKIRKTKVPTLLFHGDKDPYVPYEQSVDLDKTLSEKDIYHEFFTMKGEGHNAKGVYWDDIILHSTRFLYTTLFNYENAVFTTESGVIKAVPGETLTIVLKRKKSDSTFIKKININAPNGWKLEGDAGKPVQQESIEYKVMIPENTEKGNEYILFDLVLENGEKSGVIPVLVNVTEP
jgi:acetyl esterase/lipase